MKFSLHIHSAHSARPRATHWVDGPLAIGWGVFFVQSFFWGAVLCIKVLFDYFVIIKPIPVAVDIILQRDWLGCSTRTYTFGSWASPLPCIGGSWLLIAIRVTPPLLVCIFDTQVVYNLVLTAFGLTRGVMKLELGVIKVLLYSALFCSSLICSPLLYVHVSRSSCI